MKFFPSIVNEDEVRLLNRKGAASMAIFKTVTIFTIGYCAQAIYRGQEPSTVALAYLALAPVVLGIFTGGNAVEHITKNKKEEAREEAKQ